MKTTILIILLALAGVGIYRDKENNQANRINNQIEMMIQTNDSINLDLQQTTDLIKKMSDKRRLYNLNEDWYMNFTIGGPMMMPTH